jgi:tape measure domain-containing protein
VTSAAKYAELTTKLFKSENKGQGEILALQEAINKSFAKGAVEAETVNQIVEKSPAAAELLAKAVGVSRTELAKMASEGKISLEHLRDSFLSNADDIEAAFGNVNLTITDALLNIRNGWGLWLTQMDDTLGVTRTVAKVMTRVFNQIMSALRKVQTWTERVTKAVGGAENMLKLLAIAGGAVFLALNAGKILSFLNSMGGLISAANLKFLAIAAVVAIVALLIEDFINFMQGNDSLLGEMLKMAGVDADAIRKSIIQTWENIKSFLLQTWGTIKSVASAVWTWLKAFWEENGSSIINTLIDLWNKLKDTLSAAWGLIKTVAVTEFNALKAFWEAWGDTVLAILSSVWGLAIDTLGNALDMMAGLLKLFTALFSGDWDAAWNAVKDIASAVWNEITSIITTEEAIIAGVFSKLYSYLSDFFIGIWGGIKNVFGGVADFFSSVFSSAAAGIRNAFGGIKDFFSALFQAVANVVKAPINGIISGVNSVLGGLNKIKIPDWIPGIGGKGFNFPTIPLLRKGGVLAKGQTGYLEGDGAEAVVPLEKNTGWVKKVADLFKAQLSAKTDSDGTENGIIAAVKSVGGAMKSIISKIAQGKQAADNSGLTDAVRAFGSDIAALAKSATASPGIARSGVVSKVNRSITQNNYFDSTFNGDRTGQKWSSEAMNKSANDAMGELARTLAYVR